MPPKQRFRLDPNDFVIILMGPTGSGKSNFINNLTGNTEHRKAATLRSDTQDVTPYPISYPYQDRRLVLVDMPSFDDAHRQDTEILKVMADWLTQKYPDGTTIKIDGIIYLHRIIDYRLSASLINYLRVFGRLCGDVLLPRTRLVTTMWDLVKNQAAAIQREAQLGDEFWGTLIEGGASVHRFHNTPDSARVIVESLFSMGKNGGELLLQEELVEQQKRLYETEAGKLLYTSLQRLLADQRKMLKELATEAEQENNPDLAMSLQEECKKIDAQLQRTLEQQKEMEVPAFRRIFLSLLGQKTRGKAVRLD